MVKSPANAGVFFVLFGIITQVDRWDNWIPPRGGMMQDLQCDFITLEYKGR